MLSVTHYINTPLSTPLIVILHFLSSFFPPSNEKVLITQRHMLHLITKPPPIIRLQLRILDPLLAPILMQPAHMILRLLEKH